MTLASRAVYYMLLASLFFALMSVCVKLLERLPVLEIIFVRAAISATLCLWYIRKARVSPLGNKKGLLTLRGIAGTLSLAQNFWLLQLTPLAAATTLTHLSPITTTLLGIWFVKEKVALCTLLWFVLSFAGILMMQGFDYRISWWHLLLGISTSTTMAIAYNCVRKLSSSEHPLVIILYFPLVCLPVTGLYCLFNWVQPQGSEWAWLLLVGLTTQLGQYWMTRSYQIAEISKVAIINYTEVIFAIILGLALFGEYFNMMTYVGMALVIAGVVMSVITKQNGKDENTDTNVEEKAT